VSHIRLGFAQVELITRSITGWLPTAPLPGAGSIVIVTVREMLYHGSVDTGGAMPLG
jgi:hypothetical protein